MKAIADILDSLIRAIQLIARSVAFVLGIHVVIFLYFIRILSSEPVEPIRRQGRRRATLSATRLTRGRIFITHARPFSPARLLHLPALEPRPYEEPLERASAGIYKHLTSHILSLGRKVKYEMTDLADQMEARGGKSGGLVTKYRKRSEAELDPELLNRLPSEIINHILMTASDVVPTKICLLSRRYHRLVIPRLYKIVRLSDPQLFHQFRMTMALHNPDLGQHVESLSVGSCNFDIYGYFPEAIAESATLGTGLEQILITTTKLKHIYLDLFSLAALHDGTASRLQNGSLPISLSTEYAAPQYLSLPVFCRLQHIELSVFGLDRMAVEYLRQALPQIKSLTLRWVTRQSPGFDDMDTKEDESGVEGKDAWSQNSYQRNDFESFVDALEALRRGTNMNQSTHSPPSAAEPRQPLEAITVLAWPNVMRQLTQYYRHDEDVDILNPSQYASAEKDEVWNRSLGHQDEYSDRPRFDRPTTRRSATAQSVCSVRITPSPLRLAVDPTYKLGPRRGPLESWSNQWG